MVRSTTSDVRIVQYLQQAVLEAKLGIYTGTLSAGQTLATGLNMTVIPATLIRHNVLAAEMADTGNASSYIALEVNDGTSYVELKRATGAAPKLYWDGPPIIDNGRLLLTTRLSTVQFRLYNAGASAVTYKLAYQFEKLA
jgi:outer membrane protein assembly factor BamB